MEFSLLTAPTPRAMPEIPHLEIHEVRHARGACIHQARSVAQADVYIVDWEGCHAVLKDFSERPWIVRLIWSNWIMRRECTVLGLLQGLEGVPRLYARVGRSAFLMQRLQAHDLPNIYKQEPPPADDFWLRLRRLIDEMHRRGVAHGDLRRKNILISDDGQPFLIDFATAMLRREHGALAPLTQWLFRIYRRIDRTTFARIKQSYPPHELDELEQHWLDNQPWYLTVGRLLKRRVYRLTKWEFWKKKLSRGLRWLRRNVYDPVKDRLRRTG